MNFPYVLSDEILLRSKYEKKMEKIYVLSDCPSLYSYCAVAATYCYDVRQCGVPTWRDLTEQIQKELP